MRGRRGWRWRRGDVGRMPIPVQIKELPLERFVPVPIKNPNPIYIEPAELEAFRLVDFEELSQEEAGEKMGISRGSIWRFLNSARKKISQALTEGRELIVITAPPTPAGP